MPNGADTTVRDLWGALNDARERQAAMAEEIAAMRVEVRQALARTRPCSQLSDHLSEHRDRERAARGAVWSGLAQLVAGAVLGAAGVIVGLWLGS